MSKTKKQTNTINKKIMSAEEANWLAVQQELLNSNENILINLANNTLNIPKNISLETIINILLDLVPNPNIKDSNGSYLIHWTTFNNNIEFSKLLIKYNADINIRNSKGLTPLHLAAQFNYKELLELLLKNKATINCPDSNGNTSIFFAKYHNNETTYKLLNTINSLEKNFKMINLMEKSETSSFYTKNKLYINDLLKIRQAK